MVITAATYKDRILEYKGGKIQKFQFCGSYLISTNQDGSFDTHLAILQPLCTKCHLSKYVINFPKPKISKGEFFFGVDLLIRETSPS